MKQLAWLLGRSQRRSIPLESRMRSRSDNEPSPNRSAASTIFALESVPCLGEKSRRPSTPKITDSTPGIADRRSDQITQGSNRPSLPARHSVREVAAVPSTDRKRKRKPKQSRALTHARSHGSHSPNNNLAFTNHSFR
ncbi:hypothetical protein BHM03_00028594 [Ensete ventricosum]|nr:hypothetical protein BHM03_00028594 [Ensete ventricosum]